MGASSSRSSTSLPLILISSTFTPCFFTRLTVPLSGSNISCTFSCSPFTSRSVRMTPSSSARPDFSSMVVRRPSVEVAINVSSAPSRSSSSFLRYSRKMVIQFSTCPLRACLMGTTFTRTCPTSVGDAILAMSSRTFSYLVSASWNFSKLGKVWPCSVLSVASATKLAKKSSRLVSQRYEYSMKLMRSSSRASSVSFRDSPSTESIMLTIGLACSSRM
mmetsp:Transcript_33431/g.75575  ORF Transcript_33431/g.75575 Transcript_33431/m.75575 type:complete len:218 (+) Transcript_33431:2102-2755(+)